VIAPICYLIFDLYICYLHLDFLILLSLVPVLCTLAFLPGVEQINQSSIRTTVISTGMSEANVVEKSIQVSARSASIFFYLIFDL